MNSNPLSRGALFRLALSSSAGLLLESACADEASPRDVADGAGGESSEGEAPPAPGGQASAGEHAVVDIPGASGGEAGAATSGAGPDGGGASGAPSVVAGGAPGSGGQFSFGGVANGTGGEAAHVTVCETHVTVDGDYPHSHELVVPWADVRSGNARLYTLFGDHGHNVIFDEQDFAKLARGEAVEKTCSFSAPGPHLHVVRVVCG